MNSSQLITCRTPALPALPKDPWVRVEFILDNLVFDFATLNPTPFSYEADPTLQPLNSEDPTAPFRHKPGSVISVEVPFLLGPWTLCFAGQHCCVWQREQDSRARASGQTWPLAPHVVRDEGAGGGVPGLMCLAVAWVLSHIP